MDHGCHARPDPLRRLSHVDAASGAWGGTKRDSSVFDWGSCAASASWFLWFLPTYSAHLFSSCLSLRCMYMCVPLSQACLFQHALLRCLLLLFLLSIILLIYFFALFVSIMSCLQRHWQKAQIPLGSHVNDLADISFSEKNFSLFSLTNNRSGSSW